MQVLQFESDVLVIGGGIAGLTCAIEAQKKGSKVILASKMNPFSSQSSMAQGGINAVLDFTNDSIENHILDTVASAKGLADLKMVEFLCRSAPIAIENLVKIGVPFSLDLDNQNKLAQRKLGGTKNKRACYAQDFSGLKILHNLYDKAKMEQIEIKSTFFLLELVTKDDKIFGALFLDFCTGGLIFIKASAVVLATGGYGSMYKGYSTNSIHTSGEAIAAAFEAGAKLADMEFIQFHPTALQGSSILISESARGAGAKLLNQKGERFVDELLTRDEVARAIYSQISKGDRVFLDLTSIDKTTLIETLPQELKLALFYEGVDLLKSAVEIKPAAHYTMGGILCDQDGKSSIDGVFAVGECANMLVHGANRLGGNSLLEAVVFGEMVGKNSAKYAKEVIDTQEKMAICKKEYVKNIEELSQKWKFKFEQLINKNHKNNFYDYKKELGKILYYKVGIIRDSQSLNEALEFIENLKKLDFGLDDKNFSLNTNLIDFLEFEAMQKMAKLTILSAKNRCESRGAHFRSDFGQTRDNFSGNFILYTSNNEIKIEFKGMF